MGKSTLADPWSIHILDSLQLMSFIKNKSQSTELSLAYVRSTGTGLMNTKITYGVENGYG